MNEPKIVFRGGQHWIWCNGDMHTGEDVNGRKWIEGTCRSWAVCPNRATVNPRGALRAEGGSK